MEKGLYYLAVPYQGAKKEKEYRTELSLKAAAEFLRQGIYLFAPIIYVNKIIDELNLTTLEERRQIVMPYLFEFLKLSKGMIIVEADGWRNSWGIKQELIFCQEKQIPVFKITPESLHQNLLNTLSTSLNQNELANLLETM